MLRDYQLELVSETQDALKSLQRVLVVLATGGGKTIVAETICKDYESVLWLAHRSELLDQASKALTGHKNVTIRSIFREPPTGKYDLVVLDESHHAPAATVHNLLDKIKYNKLVGLTATPNRLDQLHLGFDTIVYGIPLDNLVKQGYLVPVELYTVRAKGDRDFTLVEWFYTHGSMMGKTIIFVTRREQAEFYKAALSPAFKTDVVLQDSNRKDILAAYQNSDLDVLVTCNVLTEGTDLPCTTSIILARHTESETLLRQMIGRGLRTHKDKNHCNVVECVPLIGRHQSSINGIITPANHYISSHNGAWRLAELKSND